MKEVKFTQFVWNRDAHDEYPTNEDIDYILKEFMRAVKERGLVCGGGVHPTDAEA